MSFKKYTKNQLIQVIKMVVQDGEINNCASCKDGSDCSGCYERIIKGYFKDLEDETYLDKYGYIRCRGCEEEIIGGYCLCRSVPDSELNG